MAEVTSRLTLHPSKPMDPELERLLAEARKRPPMTREEIDVQRRSWVIGEMMLEHTDMTCEEAERIYAEVTGK